MWYVSLIWKRCNIKLLYTLNLIEMVIFLGSPSIKQYADPFLFITVNFFLGIEGIMCLLNHTFE